MGKALKSQRIEEIEVTTGLEIIKILGDLIKSFQGVERT